jgi:uncharacterized glyoxalase superfamily protein PhnB
VTRRGKDIAILLSARRTSVNRIGMKKTLQSRMLTKAKHFHLYLETNGVSDFAAQLKANGVELVKDVHQTPWNTKEIVIHDDQGHTLYLGEPL